MHAEQLKQRTKQFALNIIALVETLPSSRTSKYWLELLLELKLTTEHRLYLLLQEANELTAIFTASGKTAGWKK